MNDFPVMWVLFSDNIHKNAFINLDERLSFLASPRGEKHSRRIQDHAILLGRKERGDIDIEQDKNDYLKESAFILHEIINFCDGLLELRNPEWETPVKFDRLRIEKERSKKIVDKYSQLTGYGVVLKIKESAEAIVEDFRLSAFRKKSLTPAQ
jgi:hypothetical protein